LRARPKNMVFARRCCGRQQQAELLRALEKTIEELNRISHGFTPKQMEARFGMGKPALVLNTSAGEGATARVH